MTDRTHLAVRHKSGGGLDATLTLPDGQEVNLGRLALAQGFAITGLDHEDPSTQVITLSCKLVITELDIDIDVLRAQLVDANGEDIPLEDLAERIAGGAR